MTAAASTLRPREPLSRRTYQPVRRNSRMTGAWEGSFMRTLTWREAHEIQRAARRYDTAQKKPGEKRGPFGHVALRLLDELLALAVNCKGHVWPTLDWMQARLGCARGTVVECLRRLSQPGFGPLEWIRRIAEADGEGPRGQRVRQISNLYRIALPERLRAFVLKRKVVEPDDELVRKKAVSDAFMAMWEGDETDPLSRSLGKLKRNLAARPAAPE